MKAALKTPDGRFEIGEVEDPVLPGPDWVKVRVRVAGICGTDLRHWQVADPKLAGEIMGHELAGEVVEVGEAVRNVASGDRVVVETVLGDGTCEWCRVQRYNLCPNLYEVRTKTVSRAFAEYVVGPAHKMYRLPDHVSFEEAALLDTYATCLHGVHLGGVEIGDKVAVVGGGPIGLGQVQLARAYGAEVVLIDHHDHSLSVGRALGATETVNSRSEDAHDKVMAFTGGRGVDVAFECAGGGSMGETLPESVGFTRIGGKVVVIGGFDAGPQPMTLEWQRLQKSEIQLVPSASYAFWGIYPEMKICLDLLAAGKLKAEPLVTHSVPLEEINRGFEIGADKTRTKAIFVAITI